MTKMQRVLLILMAIVFMLLFVAIGVIRWRRMNTTTSGDGPTPATWPEVQAVLATAVESKQYQDGGRYFADPVWRHAMRELNLSTAGKEDLRKLEACKYRETVDLVLSFTPHQADVLKGTGRLPFDELNHRQQEILLSKVEGPYTNEILRSRASESFIILASYPRDDGRQGVMFNWLVETSTAGHYSGMAGGLTPQY